MASKGESVWNYQAVPCVQELAKELTTSTNIPSRYIRNDLANNVFSDDVIDAGSMPPIPVIDFQCLVSEETADSELSKFHHACKDWGFFQVVNHGVSSSLLEKLKIGIEDFFNLPMEEKKKYWQKPGELEGFGQAFVMSNDQKLDWCDLFIINTLPPHCRNPQLFPNLPLSLRDTLDRYSLELENVAKTLLSKMAKALNMRIEEMDEFFREGRQIMRMNYYSKCPQPEKAIGISPHSDGSALTILLQASEVDGLQIKKDGKWVPIKALPNAFIVNIGDILEIITNGAYRSIEHRATVNSEKERLTVATFYGTGYVCGDEIIGPAPSLISPRKPALYKTVRVEEYLKGTFARKLEGKSVIDSMKI